MEPVGRSRMCAHYWHNVCHHADAEPELVAYRRRRRRIDGIGRQSVPSSDVCAFSGHGGSCRCGIGGHWFRWARHAAHHPLACGRRPSQVPSGGHAARRHLYDWRRPACPCCYITRGATRGNHYRLSRRTILLISFTSNKPAAGPVRLQTPPRTLVAEDQPRRSAPVNVDGVSVERADARSSLMSIWTPLRPARWESWAQTAVVNPHYCAQCSAQFAPPPVVSTSTAPAYGTNRWRGMRSKPQWSCKRPPVSFP